MKKYAVSRRIFPTNLGRGGSGVGLSLSHRLVEEVLHSSISVESESGQGGKFTNGLPKSTPKTRGEPKAELGICRAP